MLLSTLIMMITKYKSHNRKSNNKNSLKVCLDGPQEQQAGAVHYNLKITSRVLVLHQDREYRMAAYRIRETDSYP